jgi:hypothetical protein
MSISHHGIDWSTGKSGDFEDPDPNFQSDGDVIAWCENSQAGENWWSQGLWYRHESGGNNSRIYLLGSGIDESTISSIDTTKWNGSLECSVSMLKNGDVWAAKCQDGYVVFKIVDAPTDSAEVAARPTWDVGVKYKFSNTLNF